jgi:hypothetical protein
VHHPWARTKEGRGGAVGTGRRDELIFCDVTVRGEQSLREPAAGTGRRRPYDMGSHQQIHCIRGRHNATAARRAVSGRSHDRVHGIARINAAIFQNSNVRIDSRLIECRALREYSPGALS